MALRAGRVGRPHGLDGSFHVVGAQPGVLTVGRTVRAGEDETRVVAVKGTAGDPLIRLELASTREAADALRGRPLVVDDAEPAPLDDDEYAAADLEGCAVVDGDGERLGVVERLIGLPSCEALELDDGRLVPLVRDAVRAVDVAARRIEVDPAFLGT